MRTLFFALYGAQGMRRTASALAALLVTCGFPVFLSAAQPNWSLAGSAENLDTYVDTTRVAQAHGLVTAWFLLSFELKQLRPNGKAFRSAINVESIDCRQKRMDLRASYYYAGRMGGGDMVESSNFPPAGPRFVPPGSVAESMIRTACTAFQAQSRSAQFPRVARLPKSRRADGANVF